MALFAALGATILVEGALAGLWLRRWKYVFYSVLCNCITNPVMNLALLGLTRWLGPGVYWPTLAVLEAGVVAGEAALYHALGGFAWKRAFVVSAALNLCSVAAGLVLNWVI